MNIDYEEARKWHQETFKGSCELNSDNERVYNTIQNALIMAQKSGAPNKIWAVDYKGQKMWEEVGEFAPFHHIIEGDWEIQNVTAYIKYGEYVKLHDKHYGTPCEQVRHKQREKELLEAVKLLRAWASETRMFLKASITDGVGEQEVRYVIYQAGKALEQTKDCASGASTARTIKIDTEYE